ncbi:MAG: ribokinase, partial [Oligoflexales bacterium]|nr:ribokinase [Oligoflexales bacterium]
MLSIVNFGSLNIDHVYSVEHFVRPGETIASLNYQKFCGGKGLNQSVALANAGAHVYHAGKIGRDGLFLKERLEGSGVDTSCLSIGSGATG